MSMRMFALTIALCGLTALGATNDDRAKLMGTWRIQTASGGATTTSWVLQERGDKIHLTQFGNDRKLSDFDCKPTGQDCKVEDAGHSATVSIWFNGSKLVELETRGSKTVKRRFALTGQGDTMEMEMISIVLNEKPEILEFRRVPAPDRAATGTLPGTARTQ